MKKFIQAIYAILFVSSGFVKFHFIFFCPEDLIYFIILMQVDKSLSFLNAYVQESLEKGAQPYLPESERSGMSNVANFRTQEQNGTYAHSLRFEAYELPKPSQPSRASPVSLASSTELVPVPQSSYGEVYETVVSKPSASDSGSSEVKLRLDGVQRKWGKPSYSAAPSTSDSSVVKTQSGATQRDVSSFSSKAPVSNDSRKQQQVEIDPEKQRLAASLFGGASKSERRHSSAASHKASKPNSRAADKPHMDKSAPSDSGAVKTRPQPPPPDLLDLGEPTSSSAPPALDPFKQLEGLLDLSQGSSAQGSDGVSSTKMADFMSLYGDVTSSGQSEGVTNPPSTGTGNTNLIFGFSDASDRNGHGGNTTPQLATQNSKGPNPRDAIEKDALVRQMGVTPSTQNPNLFSDLLG